MKKVGLCAQFEKCNNYGTMLQAYATKFVIENLGYNCEMIRYKKKYTISYTLKQLPRVFNAMTMKATIRRRKTEKNKRKYKDFGEGYKIRTEAVNRFRKERFQNIAEYYGYEALKEGSKNYASVVVGSDQLWLPNGMGTNFYNLMFVHDDIPKISYATSFGVSQIPFYQEKRTKYYLERLDAISVREISGKKIINSLTNKPVEVVADPTLLLTAKQWENAIENRSIIKEPYILCYFLGANEECRRAANELKIKTGLKIVTLKHLDEYIPMDEKFGDYAPYDISPSDFVNLIRHASYVLTDSFHGTIFSILNHKQFTTFFRYKQGSPHSRNSRIESLFSILGLEDRIFIGTDIYNEINKKIDYSEVDEKLSILRKKSFEFLEKALKLGDIR